MPADAHWLTRRTVLELTAGTAAAGTAGLAADDSNDRVRFKVGYARSSGERAARRRAEAFHLEFAFDILSVGGEPGPGRGQHHSRMQRRGRPDADERRPPSATPPGTSPRPQPPFPRTGTDAPGPQSAPFCGGHASIGV